MISLEIRRLIMTSVKKLEKYDELKKLIAIPLKETFLFFNPYVRGKHRINGLFHLLVSIT